MTIAELLAYLSDRIDMTEVKQHKAEEQNEQGRASYFIGLRSAYSEIKGKLTTVQA